jgi:CysZ protein
MRGSPAQALSYFVEGAKIIVKPGFRRFILIPLLVNLIIFVFLSIAFYHSFKDVIDYILETLPSWLDWLIWLIWPLAAFLFLITYGYSFNLITNFIAAPFFGILAEKVETHLTGIAPPEEPWGQLIPRTLQREATKLFYFITRGLLVLILILFCFFIPGVNIIGALIGAIWSCWCMAAQYSDYPADNHQFSFQQLRAQLHQEPLTSYSFGGLILLGSMIPFLNIIVTPIGVAGATVFWVRQLNPTKIIPANSQ